MIGEQFELTAEAPMTQVPYRRSSGRIAGYVTWLYASLERGRGRRAAAARPARRSAFDREAQARVGLQPRDRPCPFTA